MASTTVRSTKKGKGAATSRSASQASNVGASSTSDTSLVGSNLSMHAQSRLDEKQQLVHLNDRLANYIERVRHLEKENRRLDICIKEMETTEKRERDNLEAVYTKELADLRRVLDDTAKTKAQLQIQADGCRAENNDLRLRVAELERELNASEAKRLSDANLVHGLQARNNTLENENRQLKDNEKKHKKERDELAAQLSTAKGQLEEETVLRVDCENRLQSAKETIEFQKNLHNQTIDEMKEKRQTEINLTTRELEQDFESRLTEELQRYRNELDAELFRQRNQLTGMYEDKMRSAKNESTASREQMAQMRDELHTIRSQFETIERERNMAETTIEALRRELQHTKDAMNARARDFDNRLQQRDEDLDRLNAEIQQRMEEYHDLMDVKVKLDHEINAYRALLEEEETRLNITASPAPGARANVSSMRGAKRRRVDDSDDDDLAHAQSMVARAKRIDAETKRFHTIEKSTIAGLKISEHDVEHGKYVRLRNDSNEELSIGAFKLQQYANGEKTQYKFLARQKMPAGSTLTVWSKGAPAELHQPPLEYVMKNNVWPVSDRIRTVLLDSNDEEVAMCESTATYGTGTVNGHEFADGEQRCSIM